MCSACFCIFPRSQDRQPMCSMCFCVFSYKALKFRHGKTPTCFLCFCVFPHPNTLQFTMAMCSMCFCVFLSIFNLARKSAPCVLRVFVFFPGPRTDNQCVLCVFVFFLTKLSNLDTAKPRRVSCVFVFFPTPTHYSSQWPCVLCVFVSFYHFLI